METAALTEETKPLSKNAQKKLAKAARFQAMKLERRAREKEQRKEKKRIRAEKRAAGELDSDEEREEEARRKRRKGDGGKQQIFGARVVIDLGFDELMSEKEITSLCSQLAYTYSANRRSSNPFSSLLFTCLNGRTLTRLETVGDASYKRWTNTEWWTDGYEKLWDAESPDSKPAGVANPQEPAEAGTDADRPTVRSKVPKESVVYLTADSSEELLELKEGETYIIGGIVDRNRYKNLCLNKANAAGIRTARLPIGTYLSDLPTRKVLTVNQVFEIMLKWVETRNWEQALYAVMPKRKFHTGNSKDKSVAGSEQGQNDHDTPGDAVEEVVVRAEDIEAAEEAP
ncbi:hypothetical protein GLOTRDRAFT_69968 [Gloeophyllum trabeum ATCC 11539]|uniref:tRNA (guanine(9)-N1)-methyltransferase n=1 Tax=Gloeophyllum trabeum (strain ATCC 11539 / FP-39264 / Madison 617) TaxID=670483 RepID=S7RVT9_GLOTA|nr:uncharacterized protein GLOTRDRAFT_69968 [Gloeophyllum trabeum ATCC 11539]EPQ58935.1 hypothetical protein GLOTRDRAFT_69968 [Gloeophyllum trabeum ATCC 11539]